MYVVGASVAIKWFVPEIHSEAAARLLDYNGELCAPGLMTLEFGALLYEKIRRNEITEQEGRDIITGFQAVPLRIEPPLPYVSLAFEVASDLSFDFYDSLYLAVAIRQQCLVVTADRDYYETLRHSPYDEYVRWVEDL